MKAKTIRTVLRKKIDEWLASIEDADVRGIAAKNVVATGGCIASMLLREKVNDYDIYFRTREACIAVANYYIGRFEPKTKKGIPCKISIDSRDPDRVRIVVKSAGVASEDGSDLGYDYFESEEANTAAGAYVSAVMDDPGEIEDENETLETAAQEIDEGPRYRPVFISTNAITLSHRVQIVTRFFGSPDEIHANYDFAHCTCYWKSWDDELVLRPAALEALLARELRYVGSKYPLCSLIRVRKFVGRGWSITAGQILKMVMQLNEMDLKDINVLQDQLTGVDAAYFAEILAKVKADDPEKLNAAYLCEVIDRLY